MWILCGFCLGGFGLGWAFFGEVGWFWFGFMVLFIFVVILFGFVKWYFQGFHLVLGRMK